MDYLDFELEIGQGSGRDYAVAVLHSPAGEARATMHFPFDHLALENHLKDLKIALLGSGGSRRRIASSEERAVQEFGSALFDALFTGEIRSRYDVSRERAEREERGLRLKLHIKSPDLAALPWELLYDARAIDFLALSRDTPLVRYLELGQTLRTLKIAPPLRVLGLVASPKDLPPLDVNNEKQRVEVALAGLSRRGLVELTWLEGQSWRDLQRAMRGGPWHVFHFVGHGGFDVPADEGVVALTSEDGCASLLTATQLGRCLADHRSLRLVFLNACDSARSGGRDILSSTASILVTRGIPAVLAMQYGITDKAAIELARAFYETIAEGSSIDSAVVEARKAVSFEVANTVEWCTPVLYMRAADGVLFDMIAPSAAPRQTAVLEPPEQLMTKLSEARPSAPPPDRPTADASSAPDSAPTPLILTPSIQLELVRVPAGEFLMGSDKTKDPLAGDKECPQHKLYLPEFFIGKHPATVAQFEAFILATGYKTSAEQQGSGWVWTEKGEWQDVKGAYWRQPGGAGSDVRAKADHPVTQMSWWDAQAFCEWASKVTGRSVMLPSEAEWEKAARGTHGRRHPWGGGQPPDYNHCNSNMIVKDTTPVGHYGPWVESPYGCTDMAGNVWEWTRSIWGQFELKPDYGYPYDAQDGREDAAPKKNVLRILRGGAFDYETRAVRCAMRFQRYSNYRARSTGFRVVASPNHS